MKEGKMEKEKTRIAIKKTVERNSKGEMYVPLNNVINSGVYVGASTMVLEREDDNTWEVTLYMEGDNVYE